MSVDDVLNYKRSEDDDLYAILGCDESATAQQITAEYRVLALQYHPDKNEGDKEAQAKFQKLKNARDILCDGESRLKYDKWRHSGIAISYKQWLGMKEHVYQSFHWSGPKTKDRMLPDGESAAGASMEPRPKANINVNRRASEGGANIHYGPRRDVWDNQPDNELIRKFRNYET